MSRSSSKSPRVCLRVAAFLVMGAGLSAAPVSTITVDNATVLKGSANHTASVPVQAGAKYLWTISNGAITSGSSISNAINYTVGQALTPTVLSCTVMDGTGQSSVGTKSVFVVDAPNATVTTPSYTTNGKAGYLASVPAQAGATYTWTTSSGGVITSGQGTNEITYTATSYYGSFYLICTVKNALGTIAYTYNNIFTVPPPESAVVQANTSYAGNYSGAKIWVNSSVLSNTYFWSILDPSFASFSRPNSEDMGQIWFDTLDYPGVNTPIHFQCIVTNAAGDSATVLGTSLLTSGAGSSNMTAAPATPGDSHVRVSISQQDGYQVATSTPAPNPQWNPATDHAYVVESDSTPAQCYVDIPMDVPAQPYGSNVSPATDNEIHICDNSGLNCGPWTHTWPARMILYSPPNAAITTAQAFVLEGTNNLSARILDQPGSFHWTITNGAITQNQGSINPVFSVDKPGITTLTCTAINLAGRHDTQTFKVTVYPKPTAVITVPKVVALRLSTGCTASVPAQDPATYSWSITGGTITAGQGTRAITYQVTGAVGTNVVLSCTVTRPTTVASPSAIGTQSVSVVADLVINEVGSSTGDTASRWVEVHNVSPLPVNLKDYQLRCPSVTKPGVAVQYGTSEAFPLPDIAIPPGGYAVIRGLVYDYLQFNGLNLACIDSSDHLRVPYWVADGFIELLKNGSTVDFVRFGASMAPPTNAAAWPVITNAPVLPNGYGQSIARDVVSTDTDRAADWKPHTLPTFGGPNDVASEVSSDGDGIPDVCKVTGSTFAGLPLYTWGARKGKKDVFIHIDYMDASQSGVPNDPGLVPTKEALAKVVAAFAAHNIAIHFDVGDLWSSTPGDTANYNLDGLSHKVAYAMMTGLPSGTPPTLPTGAVNAYKYKALSMALMEKAIFHYMLFADTQNGTNGGSSGISEMPGNDSVITLGHYSLSANSIKLNNFQAATIMHEFGHNLGLEHGGGDDTNYKPNYFSVMNYLYQLTGLSVITDPGDRYYFWRVNYGVDTGNDYQKLFSSAPVYSRYIGIGGYSLLQKGPESSDFMMDYSDGTGKSFMDLSILEADGILRTGSGSIDFNANGVIDPAAYTMAYTSKNPLPVYSDYNDWANLQFFFNEKPAGDNNIVSPSPLDKSLSTTKPIVKRDTSDDDSKTVIVETLTLPAAKR